jgi:hypothetical protein
LEFRGGSVLVALSQIYPEIAWQPWLFDEAPQVIILIFKEVHKILERDVGPIFGVFPRIEENIWIGSQSNTN